MNNKFQDILKLAKSAINDAGTNINALNNVRKLLWGYKHTSLGLLTNCQVNTLTNFIEKLRKYIEKLKINRNAEQQMLKELNELRNYQRQINNKKYNINNLLPMVQRNRENNFRELTNLLKKYERFMKEKSIKM